MLTQGLVGLDKKGLRYMEDGRVDSVPTKVTRLRSVFPMH